MPFASGVPIELNAEVGQDGKHDYCAHIVNVRNDFLAPMALARKHGHAETRQGRHAGQHHVSPRLAVVGQQECGNGEKEANEDVARAVARKVGLADGGGRSIKRGYEAGGQSDHDGNDADDQLHGELVDFRSLWLLDDLPGNSTLFFVLAGQSASMPARRAV